MTILVDTNILLDVTQHRGNFYGSARDVWFLVETGQITGYISAISFNNLFYIAERSVGRQPAFDAMNDLRRLFRIVPLDEAIIDHAIAMSSADFEDGIQIASALTIRADYIITRNEKDFISSSIPR